MSNMYLSHGVNLRVAQIVCVALLVVACVIVAGWAIRLMPKEKVIQTIYGADGSVRIDSEVYYPRNGLVEKCSARFNAIAVSADSIRLVAVSKNCEFGN